MRTSIVVLASALTAATAHAEKVGIVVTGESTLQAQLSSQLERWMHDRGRTLVPGAVPPDAISTLIDCFVLEDLGCARGVIEARAQARSVIYAQVEHVSNKGDGTRDVSITGYWFQKNADPIAERRVCKQCTDAKLMETVDDLMLALVHAPPIGTTSETAPAPATAATTTATADPIVASTSTSEPEGSSRKTLAYGLMGAGGAALLGGAIMFAIDEDPDPADTTSPTYRDSAMPGLVLGAAGAAALGVGIYLWVSDKRSSRPVAAVSHDGAVVGWAGRF